MNYAKTKRQLHTDKLPPLSQGVSSSAVRLTGRPRNAVGNCKGRRKEAPYGVEFGSKIISSIGSSSSSFQISEDPQTAPMQKTQLRDLAPDCSRISNVIIPAETKYIQFTKYISFLFIFEFLAVFHSSCFNPMPRLESTLLTPLAQHSRTLLISPHFSRIPFYQLLLLPFFFSHFLCDF